jgi:hypothetical protein
MEASWKMQGGRQRKKEEVGQAEEAGKSRQGEKQRMKSREIGKSGK